MVTHPASSPLGVAANTYTNTLSQHVPLQNTHTTTNKAYLCTTPAQPLWEEKCAPAKYSVTQSPPKTQSALRQNTHTTCVRVYPKMNAPTHPQSSSKCNFVKHVHTPHHMMSTSDTYTTTINFKMYLCKAKTQWS